MGKRSKKSLACRKRLRINGRFASNPTPPPPPDPVPSETEADLDMAAAPTVQEGDPNELQPDGEQAPDDIRSIGLQQAASTDPAPGVGSSISPQFLQQVDDGHHRGAMNALNDGPIRAVLQDIPFASDAVRQRALDANVTAHQLYERQVSAMLVGWYMGQAVRAAQMALAGEDMFRPEAVVLSHQASETNHLPPLHAPSGLPDPEPDSQQGHNPAPSYPHPA
ncbi:hypothetical protein BCR44DRAFT_367503 [Catenaria anguillulae PL171]|uniref:Uncharacterized protein n=1 Tax=Catenaria anguillulae PL171 TaxID=765915 RepID=A0A1Y2HI00_9FUNG|nr:hypothetical protein BCR44DRAFT_367503 [Catenaria anguillulae PL171]